MSKFKPLSIWFVNYFHLITVVKTFAPKESLPLGADGRLQSHTIKMTINTKTMTPPITPPIMAAKLLSDSGSLDSSALAEKNK